MGRLLSFILVLVGGILVYNYFFGSPEEKQQSANTFREIKEAAISMKSLLQSEGQKFDAGKYDKALTTIGNTFEALGTKAHTLGGQYAQRASEIEQQQRAIQDVLNSDPTLATDPTKQAALRRSMDELVRDVETLSTDVEKAN